MERCLCCVEEGWKGATQEPKGCCKRIEWADSAKEDNRRSISDGKINFIEPNYFDYPECFSCRGSIRFSFTCLSIFLLFSTVIALLFEDAKDE